MHHIQSTLDSNKKALEPNFTVITSIVYVQYSRVHRLELKQKIYTREPFYIQQYVGCKVQGLERLVGGDPDVVARLLMDDRLYPAVDVLERVTLHNSCVCEWAKG